MSVATDYHTLGALKEQECIPSQFWRPEVWKQGVGRLYFSRVLGKYLFFDFCGSLGLWLRNSMSSHGLLSLFLSLSLPSSSSLCITLIRTFVIVFRAYLDNPAWSPLQILITSSKTLLSHDVTDTSSGDWTTDRSFVRGRDSTHYRGKGRSREAG